MIVVLEVPVNWDHQKAEPGRDRGCLFHKPDVGLEPTTYSLRMSCSTNWAISANYQHRYGLKSVVFGKRTIDCSGGCYPLKDSTCCQLKIGTFNLMPWGGWLALGLLYFFLRQFFSDSRFVFASVVFGGVLPLSQRMTARKKGFCLCAVVCDDSFRRILGVGHFEYHLSEFR